MQSKTSLAIFKILAWFASIYHFVLGLIAIFGTSSFVTSAVNAVYSVNPNVDTQFLYMVKFIGAYMIAFAIACAILASKPVEYRKLVWVPISLFVIRIFERILFFSLLTQAFNSTFAQDLKVIIPIAILAIALYYFRPRASVVR